MAIIVSTSRQCRPWDTVVDPNNHNHIRCFGFALTRGQRCRNRISIVNVNWPTILNLEEKLYKNEIGQITDEELGEAMSAGLCYYHKYQNERMIEWMESWSITAAEGGGRKRGGRKRPVKTSAEGVTHSQPRTKSASATRPLEVRVQGKTCVVCCEQSPVEMFRRKPLTSTCTHEVNTCNTCLGIWLNECLNNGRWNKITCPECMAVLQHGEFKACAPKSLFRRYDDLVTRAVVSAITNFRWCLSPHCQSGQIHESEDPIFFCADCGFRHCAYHEVPWHDGETCQEYDNRKELDQTRRVIEQTTKRCPKSGCVVDIEKTDGCDHMTCRCGHEFCWQCLVPSSDSMHRPFCPYYQEPS